MPETILDFINNWLDPIGIVIGIILAVPVFATWYTVTLGEKQRRRRWFREASEQPGDRPGILALDLLPGKDITTMLEKCRQQNPALKSIPKERIVVITREKRLRPEDMPALIEEIREKTARLMCQGVGTIHYFHAGPAIAAALVGAEHANSCRVLLYQHGQSGYRNFGPLRLEQ